MFCLYKLLFLPQSCQTRSSSIFPAYQIVSPSCRTGSPLFKELSQPMSSPTNMAPRPPKIIKLTSVVPLLVVGEVTSTNKRGGSPSGLCEDRRETEVEREWSLEFSLFTQWDHWGSDWGNLSLQ